MKLISTISTGLSPVGTSNQKRIYCNRKFFDDGVWRFNVFGGRVYEVNLGLELVRRVYEANLSIELVCPEVWSCVINVRQMCVLLTVPRENIRAAST